MRIVLDVDNTICATKVDGQSYSDVLPFPDVVEILHKWKSEGHYIILQTARHMRTYDGNEGKILGNFGYFYKWLEKHNIPYDEIYIGKPNADVFIDDKAYRHTSWKDTTQFIQNIKE